MFICTTVVEVVCGNASAYTQRTTNLAGLGRQPRIVLDKDSAPPQFLSVPLESSKNGVKQGGASSAQLQTGK